MKKNWWNILITVFVFKHHRGGTKFWIQYMNWSMFLPRNKRILKNKLKNQIFLIVKGGANWSANWQCWISISKAPGALIGANTVFQKFHNIYNFTTYLDWFSKSCHQSATPSRHWRIWCRVRSSQTAHHRRIACVDPHAQRCSLQPRIWNGSLRLRPKVRASTRWSVGKREQSRWTRNNCMEESQVYNKTVDEDVSLVKYEQGMRIRRSRRTNSIG